MEADLYILAKFGTKGESGQTEIEDRIVLTRRLLSLVAPWDDGAAVGRTFRSGLILRLGKIVLGLHLGNLLLELRNAIFELRNERLRLNLLKLQLLDAVFLLVAAG